MKRSMKRTAAALAAAAAVLCAVLDSRYDLQISEYEISSPRLPKGFDGFRIVHLSDLHGASFGRSNSRLAAMVRQLEPDLIAVTGDLAGAESELKAAEDMMRGISGAAPIYYVTGNHEWAAGCVDEVSDIMGRYGAKYLSNSYEPFEWGGAEIIVAGVEDPNGRADMIKPGALALKLREQYPEQFVLWLGHRNYWVRKYPELPVDLILSGHAHGGIIRLPLIGGLLDVGAKLGAEYESGVYRSGGYCMEVSRGLGNSVFIPRLFNRPEIAVLTLRSET